MNAFYSSQKCDRIELGSQKFMFKYSSEQFTAYEIERQKAGEHWIVSFGFFLDFGEKKLRIEGAKDIDFVSEYRREWRDRERVCYVV